MRKLVYLMFFCCVSLTAFAYEPPTLQCLQLNNANTLHVVWSNTNDCEHFTEYQIFVNGVYEETFVAGSGYTMCNYSGRDIPVTASDSYSCFIKAKDEDGNLWQSNTLQMPSITVMPNADSSMALISWNPPSDVLDNTWGNSYFIYKKYEFENQFSSTPIASVPNNVNNYIDTADVCYRTVSYAVGITNTYSFPTIDGGIAYDNCIFRTDMGTVTLVDRMMPHTPVLDSVSFDENNRAALGFHAPDDRMYGYIAYFLGNNGWTSIDTIYNTTYWIDQDGGERCYRIAVLDSCLNSSSMTVNEQCGLRLYMGTVDNCRKSATVNWSTYANFSGGIGEYEIYISRDGGNSYQSVDVVDANTHSYTLENLESGVGYRVFVRVRNENRSVSASSNRVDFNVEEAASQDFSHIRLVSVVDNDHIRILVHTSGDTLPFNSITLQRSDNATDFTPIETRPYQNVSEYEFEDRSADFTKNTYYYQTFVTNTCNVESGYSNVEHNILLQGEATTAQENVLQWKQYGDALSDVDYYRVMRKQEADLDFNALPGTVESYVLNTYHDDVSALFEGGSKFKYYVAAQPTTDEYGFDDVSFSNEVMLQQMPNTYIPNAFSPRLSFNNVFMPVNTFVSSENYTFAIYSRFGDLIFMTRDPNEGWDGTVNGNRAPFGVYVYKLTYMMPDRSLYEKTGTVTLVP